MNIKDKYSMITFICDRIGYPYNPYGYIGDGADDYKPDKIKTYCKAIILKFKTPREFSYKLMNDLIVNRGAIGFVSYKTGNLVLKYNGTKTVFKEVDNKYTVTKIVITNTAYNKLSRIPYIGDISKHVYIHKREELIKNTEKHYADLLKDDEDLDFVVQLCNTIYSLKYSPKV